MMMMIGKADLDEVVGVKHEHQPRHLFGPHTFPVPSNTNPGTFPAHAA